MTFARVLLCGVLPVLVACWTYQVAMRSWRAAQAEEAGAAPAADPDRPGPGERWSWFLYRSYLPAIVVGVVLAAVPVFGTYLQRVAVLMVLPMIVGGAIGLRHGAFARRRPGGETA